MTPYERTAYVTTPIYYVNDRPHLGHVYTTTIADVVARHRRLRGDDTFFLTGTDEHAAKVVDAAAEKGVSAQEWADRTSAAFREVFARLEMTNDDFIRTTEDRHKERVTRYMTALLESGDVYPGRYEGWYDAGQEEYVPENRAREHDYRSEVTGKPLERREETNYFLKLGAYRDELVALYEARDRDGVPLVMPPARKNEILNRIREAEDVPISRTGTKGWGIPIPGDDSQTIYVWIDALFNYLTTVDTDERRHYWSCGAVHFLAKDILWFHAAIWPALLLALRRRPGYEWVNLPTQIYTHSYWVSESGVKMSKSLGNFLDPEAIDAYVGEFGLDALRYFLATRGPLGVADSAFSPELLAEVYNADLANTFGNACQRVTGMIGKYLGGRFPEPGPEVEAKTDLEAVAAEAAGRVTAAFDVLDLRRAGEAALELARAVNGFVEETEPFRMAKDPARLPEVGTVLGRCLEALRITSLLLAPFIPDRCAEFSRRIGQGDVADALADRGRGDLAAWARWGRIEAGDARGDRGSPLSEVSGMSGGETVPVEKLADRGFALLQLREWDEALAVARELEERRFSAAFDIAAQAHAGLGDLEAAVEVLERGVAAVPAAWPNWQLLGNYRSDLERFDEAAEAYERALGCPGVWTSSVRLNQAVLEGRRERFEAMLERLDEVEDEELELLATEHRVHGLAELGRHEEAEAAGLATIEGEFDPETEGPTKGRIAARLGELRRARGDDPEEIRRFAHASLRLDGASPAILSLIRELDGVRSPTAQYFRLVAEAKLAPEDPRRKSMPGYFVTYDVVADSPEDALEYVRAFEEFFPEGAAAAWSVSEAVDLEPRPDDPKGVYWRTGRSVYEDEESCEMRGEDL